MLNNIGSEIDAEGALAGVDFPESYMMSIAINAYSVYVAILSDVSGYRNVEEAESVLKYIGFDFIGLSGFSHTMKRQGFLPQYDMDKSTDLGSIYELTRTPLISTDAPFGRHQLKCKWAYGEFDFIYEKCKAFEIDPAVFED